MNDNTYAAKLTLRNAVSLTWMSSRVIDCTAAAQLSNTYCTVSVCSGMSAHGEPANTCDHVNGGNNGMLDNVVGCRNVEWNGLWNGEWNGLWNGEWNGLWNGEWNGLWNGEWNGAPNNALSWRSLPANAPA